MGRTRVTISEKRQKANRIAKSILGGVVRCAQLVGEGGFFGVVGGGRIWRSGLC